MSYQNQTKPRNPNKPKPEAHTLQCPSVSPVGVISSSKQDLTGQMAYSAASYQLSCSNKYRIYQHTYMFDPF